MNHLIEKCFHLPTEPLLFTSNVTSSSKHYFRGKRVNHSEMAELFSLTEADMTHSPYYSSGPWVTELPGADWYNSTVAGTRIAATDMTLEEFSTHAENPEVLNLAIPCYSLEINVSDWAAWHSLRDEGQHQGGYRTIKGGMSHLPQALLRDLESSNNVELKVEHTVKVVTECEGGFLIQAESNGLPFKVITKKMVLACNKSGFKRIIWNGPQCHTERLHTLMAKVNDSTAFKMFMTYRTPWWEDCSLYSGEIYTDLPLGAIVAFGERGKSENFATLLVSFTYKSSSVFEGLNLRSEERFQNSDDIPLELTPSKRLVDYVQRQLRAVFGVADLEEPVCAVCCCWFDHLLMSADNVPRVGVNAKELQWEALKPLPDLDLFMIGDSFPAVTNRGSLLGWSESALLSAERVLVNHFGMEPIIDGLSLTP